MILFAAAATGASRPLDPGPAQAALEGLLAELPFFPGRPVESWQAEGSAAVWVAHAPAQLGGVDYVSAGEARLSLFAGRPFRWSGDETAEGRSTLDADFYARPAELWAPSLDGRFAALRIAEGMLEAVTDPLGAYPLFSASASGVRWVSNSPELLRRLAGARGPRAEVLASLLGGGWSLSGSPLDAAVERLVPGRLHRLPDGPSDELLPLERVAAMPGAGFDSGRAARLLVASLSGLAGWPGRPDVVPVTGGRDSRLVLAAALVAGFEFEATTGGPADAPDVVVGRQLCERAGIPHVPLAGDPHGDMWSRPEAMAALVGRLAGGTACVADAAGFPLGPREGPLVLWHSGQGGEIARGYYSRAAARSASGLTERLYRAFTGRRPGREDLLSPDGEALVRGEIRRFVERRLEAGAAPADVPDLFYLERRMATWAGPSHTCVEPVKDTTSALWSVRLLPQLLGLPASQRVRERFHLEVLRELRPDLVDLPFEGGGGWPPRSELARRAARARSLARKAAAEARRRTAAAGRPAPADGGRGAATPPDPFARVHQSVAAAVARGGDNPAWQVLERGRVDRLLARPPDSLDTLSRYYVWRLGQVFWQG